MKQLKNNLLQSSIKNIGLIQEIEELLKIAIDYCKYNSDVANLSSLEILLNIIKIKTIKLSTISDNDMIEIINFN